MLPSIYFLFWLFAIIPIIVIVGIIALIINHNRNSNSMDTNQRKTSIKEFFLVTLSFIALFVVVSNLLNLLFTIINTQYPKVTSYDFFGTPSISLPVAILLVSFPLLILFRWLMAKEYVVYPELQNSALNRWLNYLTLVIAGATIVGDLITVLYYFIDGQEITTAFILKVVTLLVVAGCVFSYFLAELKDRLTPNMRMAWRVVSTILVVGSIILGFAILGSPRTQRLYKYDEQKVSDLQNINNSIITYYSMNNKLPATLAEATTQGYFYGSEFDPQTGSPYEYKKKDQVFYELCAEFNKPSRKREELGVSVARFGGSAWTHPEGYYCFIESVSPDMIPSPVKY